MYLRNLSFTSLPKGTALLRAKIQLFDKIKRNKHLKNDKIKRNNTPCFDKIKRKDKGKASLTGCNQYSPMFIGWAWMGLHLLPSVCDSKLIQQTLLSVYLLLDDKERVIYIIYLDSQSLLIYKIHLLFYNRAQKYQKILFSSRLFRV